MVCVSVCPDLTVITPVSVCVICVCDMCSMQVFYSDCDDPVFFVASRGHHADIGGITPGKPRPLTTPIDPAPLRFYAPTLHTTVGGRNERQELQVGV